MGLILIEKLESCIIHDSASGRKIRLRRLSSREDVQRESRIMLGEVEVREEVRGE